MEDGQRLRYEYKVYQYSDARRISFVFMAYFKTAEPDSLPWVWIMEVLRLARQG